MEQNIERQIEKTIYKATIALDELNWHAWFKLCDDSFHYSITSFSPEINKDMIYFSGDKKELESLMEMLPKHNTDHSPLRRHTSVYTVDVSDDGKTAEAVSSVVVYQNMLDGINAHLDSGESRLFVVGKYHDKFTINDGVAKFVNRETKLDNRRMDKGSHWPNSKYVELKKEVIKMSWIKVCKTSEVEPGSIKKLWASVGGGIPLVVAHHKAGFTALPPICPHMEEPLDESGTILGCKLTCTKHLWSWDLETLELQDEAELPLKTYDTKVDGENVMVYVTEQLEYDFDEEDDIDDDEFFGDDDDDDFD